VRAGWAAAALAAAAAAIVVGPAHIVMMASSCSAYSDGQPASAPPPPRTALLALVVPYSPYLPYICPSTIQVIIMFFLGGIFKVERLSGLEWGVSILIGLGSIPLCILTKAIPK
jgi:hypothetical protein